MMALLIVNQKNVNAGDVNHITADGGTYNNEYGQKETWYNLDMSGIVRRMRDRGYSVEEYPYWVKPDTREKMLGDYIMVAADLSIYKRGTIVNTSLGPGIVCDTGKDIKGQRFDLAVDWEVFNN